MAYGYKHDYRPLFAPGRHFLDLFQVETMCVSAFGESQTRYRLYLKLEEMVQDLLRQTIVCDVMVNGSFVTECINPDDIDVATHISSDFSELLSSSQKNLLNQLADGTYAMGLDSFVEVEYPRDHPEHADWRVEKSWGEQWGIEHSKQWCKGVVVLRLWETNVGLRIRR